MKNAKDTAGDLYNKAGEAIGNMTAGKHAHEEVKTEEVKEEVVAEAVVEENKPE